MGQKWNLGVTFTLLGVGENVKEWAHALPSGLPFWELEFLWSPESLESNLKGQNSLDRRLIYAIENLLRHICLKWVCMIHLSTYNISYGRKKGKKSKCQFDSRPLQVRNHLELYACRRHATYHWKAFEKSYNFALNLTSIKGLHKKLWAYKVTRFPILKILGFPSWEPWEKWHLGATHMANHIEK